MNPYDIFPKVFKTYPIKYWEMHNEKYLPLKIAIDKTPYKKVIVGASPVSTSFFFLDGKENFVLWSTRTNMNFLTEALKFFLKNHYTVKNAYIGLDVSLFIKNEIDNKNFNDKVTLSDYIKFLYSIDIFLDSLHQAESNIQSFITEKKVKSSTMSFKPFNHPHYKKLEFIYEEYNKVEEMEKLCLEKGIDVKYFIPACHALYLARLWETGEYEKYEDFKRELVKRFNYTDFAYVNKYSSIPFPKENETVPFLGFWDVEHSCQAIGILMYEKLENKKSEIGIDVNKENIEAVLKLERKYLQEYIKKNKNYIKEYMTHYNDKDNNISYSFYANIQN